MGGGFSKPTKQKLSIEDHLYDAVRFLNHKKIESITKSDDFALDETVAANLLGRSIKANDLASINALCKLYNKIEINVSRLSIMGDDGHIFSKPSEFSKHVYENNEYLSISTHTTSPKERAKEILSFLESSEKAKSGEEDCEIRPYKGNSKKVEEDLRVEEIEEEEGVNDVRPPRAVTPNPTANSFTNKDYQKS
jgi:hypothetical protein